MNPKAKIYLSLFQEAISAGLDSDRTRCQSGISADGKSSIQSLGELFAQIAVAYIYETGDDETDYWFSFVYDLSTTLGWQNDQGKAPRRVDEKKMRILELCSITQNSALNGSVAEGLVDLVKGYLEYQEAANREKIKKAILTYTYNLVSLDRQITEKESRFYKKFECSFNDKIKQTDEGSVSIESTRHGMDKKHEDISGIIKEINALTGLENIKTEVKSIINMIQIQQMRKERGLKQLEMSNHMVFLGNPGTGKTTIARKLGNIYRILGLLSKGHFIETDRSGLVAGYLGQTAIKTTDVLNSALGGILFIDEAYSLANEESHDQYGQEAIETLLKYMEDHRDDLIVIVAGYSEQMVRFIDSNPGLKSRFNKYLVFQDYDATELAEIYSSMTKDAHYAMTPCAWHKIKELCHEITLIKTKNFGNGRAIRNLFEKTVARQANRLIESGVTEEIQLQTIESEDISREDMIDVC
jgi:SpoVK/Ycf46/Vps4 family AAA+-type ATPase